jgi:uncharacterized RDD family membrane protein YckC
MNELEQIASAAREQTTTGTIRPATALSRFVAALADVVLAGLLALGAAKLAIIFAVFAGFHALYGMYIAAPWIVAVLYSTVEILTDNSFGKGIAGIVISSPEGGRVKRKRLVYRWLIKYSFLILMVPAVVIQMLIEYGDEQADFSRSTEKILAIASIIATIIWMLALGIVLCGSTGVFFASGRTLHDSVAGTAVVNHLDRAQKLKRKKKRVAVQETIEPAKIDEEIVAEVIEEDDIQKPPTTEERPA